MIIPASGDFVDEVENTNVKVVGNIHSVEVDAQDKNVVKYETKRSRRMNYPQKH